MDKDTIKDIYSDFEVSSDISQTSASTNEDKKEVDKNTHQKWRKKKNRKQQSWKTSDKAEPPITSIDDNFYSEGMMGPGKPNAINSNIFHVDEEVRPFAEDPSLQYIIQCHIQVEQEEKMNSDYNYEKSEFPSLLSGDSLKKINRK